MKTFDELFTGQHPFEIFDAISSGNLSREHFLEWYRMNDTKTYSQGYGDGLLAHWEPL